MADESERVPLSICWHCDRPLDSAKSVENEDVHPEPGSVSLCLYCGAIGFFGEDLKLIPPTENDLDELGEMGEFRQSFTSFSWVRQYVMIRESLLRGDRSDPDR